MEKLYKATAQGNVEMTPEEEKEVRDFWAKEAGRPLPVRQPSVEERLKELEDKINALTAQLKIATVDKKGV